ncbi:MAG TPA: universal stress protein [Gemmataceae bacterium]|jgi:nucleotide-binding universal stress UspA family protein
MIDLHRILVPTDFSKSSSNALVYGAEFARRFGAEVHLLHVVQDLALFIPEAVMLAPPMMPPIEQFVSAARAALERAVRDLNMTDVRIVPEVAEGTPFEEIVRFARDKEIDLIVMGTHGHTGLAHLFLGSVAEKVVRRAPCPVLTVRHPEHEFVHP